MTQITGLIVRTQSGFYTVQVGQQLLTCQLRGRMKQGPRLGDIVAVGDRVQVEPETEIKGTITAVEPRSRQISRLDPTPHGVYEQIIIANPDQAVFVYACASPSPKLGMLDRFLVIAEKQNVPILIVANKADLVSEAEAQALFGPYAEIGYDLLYISALKNEGIEAFRQRLAGKISLLAGPSGVGKSSLLNAIQPGLGLAVQAVSKGTGKGQHTTVVRELFPLLDGGYIADTPGLKALALWDIKPEELDAYFPEIRSLVADCGFSDCTHIHEPGCAVRRAVDAGRISARRYASYVRMRFGRMED